MSRRGIRGSLKGPRNREKKSLLGADDLCEEDGGTVIQLQEIDGATYPRQGSPAENSQPQSEILSTGVNDFTAIDLGDYKHPFYKSSTYGTLSTNSDCIVHANHTASDDEPRLVVKQNGRNVISIVDHVDITKLSPDTVYGRLSYENLKENDDNGRKLYIKRIQRLWGRFNRKGEYKLCKAISGFIVGVLLGLIITFLVFFGQGYFMKDTDQRMAMQDQSSSSSSSSSSPSSSRNGRFTDLKIPPDWACAGAAFFSLVLGFALATSTSMRCITMLMIPALSTTRGREVMLTVIMQLLLAGPLTNTIENAQKIPEATNCQLQLVANETNMVEGYLKNQLNHVETEYQTSVQKLLEFQLQALESLVESRKSLIHDFANILQIDVKHMNLDFSVVVRNVTFNDEDFDNYNNTVAFTKYYRTPNISTDRNLDTIKSGVENEFSQRTVTLRRMVAILIFVFPFSVILLFIQAFVYFRGYTTSLEYDNMFITTQFKKIDSDRKSRNKTTLLPMRQRESVNLVDSTSVCLSRREASTFVFGFLLFGIFLALGVFLCLMDYGLFLTLEIVSNHANVTLLISGGTGFQINLPEGGFSPNLKALLQQEFPSAFNSNLTILDYISTTDTGRCLPKPNSPFIRNQPKMTSLSLLYLAVLLVTTLQSYGVRLQHKIAAYFYPERETKRVTYLYHTLMTQRVTFAQLLVRKFREGEECPPEEPPCLNDWITRRYPLISKWSSHLGLCNQPTCISCAARLNLRRVGDEWCCIVCLQDSSSNPNLSLSSNSP